MNRLALFENEFDAQGKHKFSLSAPEVFEYLPATQSRQLSSDEAATCSEYLPARQSSHVAELFAPTVDECFPAQASSHQLEPTQYRFLASCEVASALPVCEDRGTSRRIKVEEASQYRRRSPRKSRSN